MAQSRSASRATNPRPRPHLRASVRLPTRRVRPDIHHSSTPLRARCPSLLGRQTSRSRSTLKRACLASHHLRRTAGRIALAGHCGETSRTGCSKDIAPRPSPHMRCGAGVGGQRIVRPHLVVPPVAPGAAPSRNSRICPPSGPSRPTRTRWAPRTPGHQRRMYGIPRFRHRGRRKVEGH